MVEEVLEQEDESQEESQDKVESLEKDEPQDEPLEESLDDPEQQIPAFLKIRYVLRRILNFLSTVLIVVLAVLLVYIFVCTHRGRAANLFGINVLHVVTGSMEPTISVDDFVIVKQTDASSLKETDIIAYYSENKDIKGKMVIHRIVEVNPDGTFITMGDANPIPDELSVRPDQIVGKYAGRAWILNWVVSFVSLRKLLLLLVILPMFFISIYEVRTLAVVFKKVKSEKKAAKGLEDSEESVEERIERLKREAVEEYKRSLAAEGADKEKDGEEA